MKRAATEFYAGMTIQQAYLKLIEEAVSCNEHVFAEINDKTISSKMPIDEVMMLFGSQGLEEHAEECRKRIEEYKRKEREWQEKMPEEIKKYKADALAYVTMHEDEFDSMTEKSFANIYHGMEMQTALEIAKLWMETNGDFEKCKELFYKQGHSGCSAALCGRMLDYFFVEGLGSKINE